ncbi:hypothetical protein [Allonocardiopsis opalescens]|uniref:HEAT repeat protein n=1 Tax=Allonocardiopsis opalescens TaxID=1144618 RepID=A0A2T0Q7R1_9ACTN|nr:hypothetical protein [Allonocardiopsis opalescens]PRX99890.1 hypothetical protein CLV72_103497 [Allonocardiopsis opalescens]
MSPSTAEEMEELALRARRGRLDAAGVDAAAAAIASGTDPQTRRTALRVLYYAGSAAAHLPLVRRTLRESRDPDELIHCLRIVGRRWHAVAACEAEVDRLVRGVPWDETGDVRVSACSAAAEHLRGAASCTLLTALLDLHDAAASEDERLWALRCLAYADRATDELYPPERPPLEADAPFARSVVADARDRLRRDCADA